jgi:hypothetical protein
VCVEAVDVCMYVDVFVEQKHQGKQVKKKRKKSI